jgi:pimeloyl-ACP methyl ester carboxylesterase
MQGATESIISTNGVDLRVYEAGPKGTPVVLCHGFPELAYSWRHQIQPLADAGYHVIAPDQRGYGGSSTPERVEDYRIEELHADLLGLLDHHGYADAHFVGHDWGSFVVWEMALRHPERVRSVTGVSVPFIKFPLPPTDLFKMASNGGKDFFYILYFQQVGPAEKELEADTHRTMRMILWGASGDRAKTITEMPAPRPAEGTGFLDMMEEPPSPLPAWLTEEDVQVYADGFAKSGFFGPVSWYRNFDRNYETAKDLDPAVMTMPSFFIGGERDGVIANRGGIEAMKELLPNLKGVVLIPEAGHWTQQEAPAAFNEALLGFLGSL